ncbi:unnamed protein product [Rodentolepis nana]|uniref:Uncharacterized protein n=1 Tax=Rodentolepis nana TaxID=102285 RepID=A0A0R3TTU3_RODNA|nr:unnamed protein product [Rodentolepis nana]
MESELWNLLSELVTRTLGHSMNSQLERVRSQIPESCLQLQAIVGQIDSLLHHLEGRHRQRILTRILSSISVGIEHIWHFSASCLRVCYDAEDSSECIATACRVALQQSWYTDTGSPGFNHGPDLLTGSSSIRPVIYLSPAAPTHLRRWLSLNLCCSGLLITVLPPDESSLLPVISLTHFEKAIQNDLRQGRRPLLLVAYADTISEMWLKMFASHGTLASVIASNVYQPDYLGLCLPISRPKTYAYNCKSGESS